MKLITNFLKQLITLSTDGEIPEHLEDELKDSIVSGQFEFLKKDDTVIGFFTYNIDSDTVEICNMCIFEQYRNKNNLLFLRG